MNFFYKILLTNRSERFKVILRNKFKLKTNV